MLIEAGFDVAFEMSGGDADDPPAQYHPSRDAETPVTSPGW